ncbi:MAG: hypothetical protein IPL61_18565 [Myxococcales bacterium]|nr:hypothetical protein [Myxococcales bacterium]
MPSARVARLGSIVGVAAVALVLGSGCGRSSRPAPAAGPAVERDAESTTGPAIGPVVLVDAGAAVTAADAAAVATAAAAARAGRGDSCKADVDCGWDDPCMPARCGRAPAAAAMAACDESAPPPGACGCVDRQCTLRRIAPAADPSAACRGDDDCALDVGAARCAAGTPGMLGPLTEQGPICTCAPSGQCAWSWPDAVPCTSWRDCSWTRAPRLRPVSARAVPRPVAHPVAPCKDGEVDSVCAPSGTCRIVGWGC